ncbi:MAG: GNAT family N-acetyltransferase [Simkaniaceae bacterium]|nr:GNAT family N-acetyltransferase [Simkaniaceae bacterium]
MHLRRDSRTTQSALPLKAHLHHFLKSLCSYTSHGDYQSYLSGLPLPFTNVLLNTPAENQWSAAIEAQLAQIAHPFCWYFDENSEFKEALLARGFQDAGLFKGVIGPIGDYPESEYEIGTPGEMMEVLSPIFDLEGSGFEALLHHPNQYNYLIRRGGTPVTALTAFEHEGIVSIWNVASLSHVRNKGLATSLWRAALQQAKKRDCTMSVSYLMAEGNAHGICEKLGMKTAWEFNSMYHMKVD